MLITFTGESGSGKSTIARSLMKLNSFYLLTSSTTRAARPSDLPDEYEYLFEEEFKLLEKSGAFIWTASYAGNNYGTKYGYINEVLDDRDTYHILILVPQVLPILLDYTEKAIPFFIRTPNELVLRKRMEERGDSAENIEKRLEHFWEWEREADKSEINYRFINNEGSIEDAVRQVLGYLK